MNALTDLKRQDNNIYKSVIKNIMLQRFDKKTGKYISVGLIDRDVENIENVKIENTSSDIIFVYKTCKNCNILKSSSDFYKGSRRCKNCMFIERMQKKAVKEIIEQIGCEKAVMVKEKKKERFLSDKICDGCNIYKSGDNFYKGKAKCKNCLKLERERRKEKEE